MDGALLRIKHRTSWTGWVQRGLLAGMLTLVACNSQPPITGDTTPPAMPQNLAVASEDEVNLSWQAVSESDLKGYNLYIGTSPDALSPVGLVDKESTSKILEDLEDQTEYFFALDAEDMSGNKSARTAPISLLRKDTKPPKLIASTPKNGTKDVSVAIPTISFSFNEAVQPDSLKLACTFVREGSPNPADCGVGIGNGHFDAPTWSNKNKTVTYTRKGNELVLGAMYRLEISGGKDKAGNVMAKTTIGFQTTTSQAPKLVSSVPAHKASDVHPRIPSISFTFSEPMQTNSVKLDCAVIIPTYPAAKCGKDGSGYFANPVWSNGDRTLSFSRLGNRLSPGMGPVYNLTLTGAKNKAGNAMGDVLVSFTTAVSTDPELDSSYPRTGNKNVPNRLEEVWFRFSKSMNPASLKVKCLDSNEACTLTLNNWLGKPTWSNENRRVSFKPTQPLAISTTYSWVLEGKDTSDLPLPNPQVIFNTTEPPRLMRYSPTEGSAGNVPDARISLVFHKQMDIASLKSAISGSVSAWDGSTYRPLMISDIQMSQPASGGYQYSFIPDRPHDYAKVVVWVLNTKATDTYGNRIPEVYSGGFRTIRHFSLAIPADPKMIARVYRICEGIGGTICDNGYQGGVLVAGYYGGGTFEQKTVERAAIGFTYSSSFFPANARFVKATLNLKHRGTLGTPFAQDKLGPLSIERVNFGSVMDKTDFDTSPLSCHQGRTCFARFNGPPEPIGGPVDVLDYFLADWAERATKGYNSHFRLRFANNKPISGGVNQDQIIYYDSSPTLTIEYLIP